MGETMVETAKVEGPVIVICECGCVVAMRPPQYTDECDTCGRVYRLVVQVEAKKGTDG